MRYQPTRSARPERIAVLDIETIAPASPDGSFPPWPLHEPVVASILTADYKRYGQWSFALESVSFQEDPAAAIERVSHLIEGRTLVSFNGRGFDVPVLALTAMNHRSFGLGGLASAWHSHRFTGDHIDLADVVTGFGGAQRACLEVLCKVLAIPAKLDTHGSEVGAMMEQGRAEEVLQYCEQDVLSTLFLYAMIQGLRTADGCYAGSLITQAGLWAKRNGLAHLSAFERIDGHEALNRLSLLNIANEGLNSLEHRVQLASMTKLSGQSGIFNPGWSDFPA